MLKVGTKAPDFILPVTPDQKVRLKELEGSKVILVFYPADWSPVCGDQLVLYNGNISAYGIGNRVFYKKNELLDSLRKLRYR